MLMAKAKPKRKCFSGTDRWRPGSVIPIGFCTRPDWYEAVVKGANEWNARFPYITLSPVPCVERDTPGAIAIVEGRILAGGVPHHGMTVPIRGSDGYFSAALITINTIDFYHEAGGESALVCHEGGHAIGAGHVGAGDGGCMERPVLPNDPDFPGTITLANLTAAYTAPEVCRKKKRKS
jgi:hypothetical protein